jgi:hypothetical protein
VPSKSGVDECGILSAAGGEALRLVEECKWGLHMKIVNAMLERVNRQRIYSKMKRAIAHNERTMGDTQEGRLPDARSLRDSRNSSGRHRTQHNAQGMHQPTTHKKSAFQHARQVRLLASGVGVSLRFTPRAVVPQRGPISA